MKFMKEYVKVIIIFSSILTLWMLKLQGKRKHEEKDRKREEKKMKKR